MKNRLKTPWSIVLAAGDGSRLRELTTTSTGDTIPKQFCSLNRRETLLQLALQRAAAVSSPSRVGTIVAAQHRRWWQGLLEDMPPKNLIVQPSNRGTAVGTALALLHIERQDPEAIVALLPADHYVRDERILAASLKDLAAKGFEDQSSVFLLGARPDGVDTELGYIVPRDSNADGTQGVAEFVEKPSAARARELLTTGALWNMFIVAGALPALLALFESAYNLLEPMRAALVKPVGSLARLYSELPTVDFSRDVLGHYAAKLKVLAVRPCGWTDLGTPKRVAATIKESIRGGAADRSQGEALYLDLARAVGAD